MMVRLRVQRTKIVARFLFVNVKGLHIYNIYKKYKGTHLRTTEHYYQVVPYNSCITVIKGHHNIKFYHEKKKDLHENIELIPMYIPGTRIC